MTPKEVKATVDEAFHALRRACDGFAGAADLFDRAHEAASDEEKGHRRHGSRLSSERYRSSVETSARYFVVRDFIKPASVKNALDATSIKKSSLYAAALRDLLKLVPPDVIRANVLRIDYADHLSQPSPDAARKPAGPRSRRARPARGPSEWQREEAMQLGMGLGVEAYNDAMGWGE